jgi:hypothetical protein
MSNSHAIANEFHSVTSKSAATRNIDDRYPAANEPTAQPVDAPRYNQEPFETDGPATCLVWF